MSIPNYNGKQPNNTAYIKNFVYGVPISLWKAVRFPNLNIQALTPSSSYYDNVYIPGNLYIDGSIIKPSDELLKEDVNKLDEETTNKLLNLNVVKYCLKDDVTKKVQYGFIAQEFATEYEELVTDKPDNKYSNIKGIDYLAIIPLLVHKIQQMQCEINELKELINERDG
jgi:hypothetical protein